MSNKLPNGWKECKLGEVIEIFGGGTPRTDVAEYWNGEIAWLSVADFNHGRKYVYDTEKKISKKGFQNSSTKMLKKGDIIISARGTVGAIAVLRKEMAFNQSCYGIRALENITTNDYIYYLIKDTVSNFLQIAHGGVFDTITRDTFNEIDILLPPLPEQRAISSVLSSLDDKIDLLHRENKTLEAMAETLFRHWFIEEAKDEWEEVKLGEVVTITYGKNLPIKKLLKNGYPVFGGNGQIGFYNKYLYDEPQVLVSCRGEASGKVNISLPRSFITNNSLILVRDKRKEITFEYLKYHSLNYDFTLHVTGSAQSQITIDSLYDAAFLIPPVDLINKFTEIVRGCEEKRTNNLKQIHTLEKLRDTLLPKLMSGEVRVKYEKEEVR